jgi:TolA-binding protein
VSNREKDMMRISVCSGCRWWAAIAVVLLASTSPAFAVNRHVIELQVRVRGMSDQTMILQQSMDESFGAMTQSLQQTAAELAASQNRLAKLQRAVRATSKSARDGSLAQQISALRQSTSDLDARMQQIERQVQTLSAEIGPPAQTAVATGAALPPGVLFRNGMEDYEAGRYKLASREFAEYLKFYSVADQAALAQFYLADSEYWAGDYQSAVRDFGKVEQQYPGIKTATVELRKGLCLMKLAEPDAARNEFHYIIERYPNSVEAMDARSALERLGMAANDDSGNNVALTG